MKMMVAARKLKKMIVKNIIRIKRTINKKMKSTKKYSRNINSEGN